FLFSSRRRHTRSKRDWSSDVCSSDLTITVATTLLAIVSHLDGAGASTFLITIPAMLPLYERMGMSRLVLATCVALGAGVMNVLRSEERRVGTEGRVRRSRGG